MRESSDDARDASFRCEESELQAQCPIVAHKDGNVHAMHQPGRQRPSCSIAVVRPSNPRDAFSAGARATPAPGPRARVAALAAVLRGAVARAAVVARHGRLRATIAHARSRTKESVSDLQ
eukprot:1748235-Pleurochrysis_carterae.AAC.1